MSQAMHDHLMKLCKDAGDDGVQAAIVYKSVGTPVMGALRYVGDGIFELMAPAQLAQNQPPLLASAFFTADAVERVMTFREMPAILQPSRGIHIPA